MFGALKSRSTHLKLFFQGRALQTYSRIRDHAVSLHLDNPLRKLDTAQFNREWKRVPFPQNLLLNSCHPLPGASVLGVVYAKSHVSVTTILNGRISLPSTSSHLHVPKNQRIQASRCLHDVFQHHSIPTRQPQKILYCLQHVGGQLFLLGRCQHGACKRLR